MPVTINRVNGTGWPPASPAGADACILQLFQDVGAWINVSANITLDVKVTWTNTGLVASSLANGAAGTNYAGIKTILQGFSDSVANNIKSTAYATLPAGDPSPHATYSRRTLWKAICDGTSYSNDGLGGYNTIQIDSSQTWDTDQTGASCAVGKRSLYAAGLHELSELLGRFSGLPQNVTMPLDLFSYSAASTRSFSDAGRYSSWDDGATSLNGSTTYDSTAGLDFLDWSAVVTGTGYRGASDGSPWGPVGTARTDWPRYEDVQILALLLPLTQTGLWYAGLSKNTVAPTIAGTATQGETLTVTDVGTWVGQGTITKTYQWKRDGSSIGGATSSTYALTGADVGTSITCVETGTNTIGATTATSNSLGPVAASASPSFGSLSLQLHR